MVKIRISTLTDFEKFIEPEKFCKKAEFNSWGTVTRFRPSNPSPQELIRFYKVKNTPFLRKVVLNREF